MLYEILTLKPAFDAHNLISLFYKIVKADFEVSQRSTLGWGDKHSAGLRVRVRVRVWLP